jgi:hypothetical protein
MTPLLHKSAKMACNAHSARTADPYACGGSHAAGGGTIDDKLMLLAHGKVRTI